MATTTYAIELNFAEQLSFTRRHATASGTRQGAREREQRRVRNRLNRLGDDASSLSRSHRLRLNDGNGFWFFDGGRIDVLQATLDHLDK